MECYVDFFFEFDDVVSSFVGTDACTNLIVGKKRVGRWINPLFLILLTHTVCLVSYIIFLQERTKRNNG